MPQGLGSESQGVSGIRECKGLTIRSLTGIRDSQRLGGVMDYGMVLGLRSVTRIRVCEGLGSVTLS